MLSILLTYHNGFSKVHHTFLWSLAEYMNLKLVLVWSDQNVCTNLIVLVLQGFEES